MAPAGFWSCAAGVRPRPAVLLPRGPCRVVDAGACRILARLQPAPLLLYAPSGVVAAGACRILAPLLRSRRSANTAEYVQIFQIKPTAHQYGHIRPNTPKYV